MKTDEDNLLINHQTTTALVISLPITPFEKSRERIRQKSVHVSTLNARELHSKTVDDHGTDAMVQSKRGEHRKN